MASSNIQAIILSIGTIVAGIWTYLLFVRQRLHYPKVNINIDINERIENLPVGLQQKVEILKILYRNADILILDEPTAVLTPQEKDELFKSLRDLKKQGKTIILITHKLDEVKSISDSVTVLRRGKLAGVLQSFN